jgi:phosphoglycolate phosphatase
VHRWDSVLFDLDGVLVDSRVPFAKSINAALAAHGLPVFPEQELHGYLGPPLHATFERLVNGRSELVQPCVDVYRERYRATAAAVTPIFEGIPECLSELAPAMPCVVATSKPQALAEPLLTALGLRHFFDAVVGPSLEVEHESKDVTVGRALQALPAGSRPVMVGDRMFDIAAGRAHGIATIGVLWGIGSEAELRDAGADLLTESPAHLTTMLRDGLAAQPA